MARGNSLLAVFLVAIVCTAQANIQATGTWKGLDDLKKSMASRPEERSILGHEGHEEDESPPPMEDPSPKYFQLSPEVKDADTSVSALLGDGRTVDQGGEITCELVAALGFCFADSIIPALCPKSCMDAGMMDTSAFCNGDNDELFRQYVNLLAPAMPTADLTCAAVAPGGGLTTVIYPSSDQYHACAEPAIASFCAETCKTNCWSFPPLRTVDVYLPGCHPTDLDFNPSFKVAKDAQRLMYNTMSDDSRVKQCPP